MHPSTQAVAAKYNRHLFLTVLEAGTFQVKVLADLVLGESFLPGLQAATFLLCLPRVAERELASKLLVSLLTNARIPP